MKNKIYYDYSVIDGYDCPLKIVISRRGLGKTFGKIKKFVEEFLTKKHRFIYVVETDEMVKQLSKNNGEKFFCKLIEYYAERDTSRKRYFYNKITEMKLEGSSEDENIQEEMFSRKSSAKLCGGIIKINGETAGYVVDLNSYGELKRNNFVKVKYIFVDEFISEILDKRSLQNPLKINSIIQSIARTDDIKIYMAGNAVRVDDSILARMNFNLKDFGFYKYYDKYGLFAVLHYVDNADYPLFEEKHSKSVAGRFSKMLNEDNEERNVFSNDLPESRRLTSFKYKKSGISFNIVKDGTVVSLRELENGNIACVPFCVGRAKNLFCLTQGEQGFKFGYHVIYKKEFKQLILNMLNADMIYYYSGVEYAQLKYIVKGA